MLKHKICSYCKRKSSSNPGPKCAQKILAGIVSRKNSLDFFAESKLPHIFKNLDWHGPNNDLLNIFKKIEEKVVLIFLKTARFKDIDFLKSSGLNKKIYTEALAQNPSTSSFRTHFLENFDEDIRMLFIRTHKLTDKETENALKDPYPFVFMEALQKEDTKQQTIIKVFNSSSVSIERKIEIILSKKCPESLLIQAARSKICRYREEIIMNREEISYNLARNLIANTNSKTLLNRMKERPDCEIWINSINNRLKEIGEHEE